MPTMLIGLVTSSARVTQAQVVKVAKALNTQMIRDVGPAWGVSAEVIALDNPQTIPKGLSPIIIVDKMPGTVKGIHEFQNGVPFAYILASDDWSLSASHECIEMLVDPSGEDTRPGRGLQIVDGSVRDTGDIVDFILEAADPVEDPQFGYPIDDVLVSDFYTQSYFDDAAKPDTLYSHRGAVSGPRQVAENGYLSWRERGTGTLRQLRCFGGVPEIVTLAGPQAAVARLKEGDRAPHLRCYIDEQTETPRVRRHKPVS